MHKSQNFPICESSRNKMVSDCEFLINRHNELCEIEKLMADDFVLNKYIHNAARCDHKGMYKDKSDLYVALKLISARIYNVDRFEETRGITVDEFISENYKLRGEVERLQATLNELKTVINEKEYQTNNE